MPAEAEEIGALLARVPAFAELAAVSCGAWPPSPSRASFAAGEVVFREGDDVDTCYVVRSGHARADPRARRTAARSRSRPSGRARSSASSRCSTTSGGQRPSRRSTTLDGAGRSSASDMRRLMREHAEIAVKLAIALVRRLRNANERLARQSFQTVQSRVPTVLAQLVEEARTRAPARRDVPDHRDAGRPREARGLVARVGQPLPRGARAGRGHLAGPRAADRARP